MTDSDHTIPAGQLQEALRQFTGSQHWHRHGMFPAYLYTDGVEYLAEQAGAYWLIDTILACQLDPRVAKEPFQFWTLTVNDDRSAVLTCTDGNYGDVYRQAFAYTDFPLEKISLWLKDAVLFLPSEH
jgi:hypothetical protein